MLRKVSLLDLVDSFEDHLVSVLVVKTDQNGFHLLEEPASQNQVARQDEFEVLVVLFQSLFKELLCQWEFCDHEFAQGERIGFQRVLLGLESEDGPQIEDGVAPNLLLKDDRTTERQHSETGPNVLPVVDTVCSQVHNALENAADLGHCKFNRVHRV